MGCTCDIINAKFSKLEDAEKFSKFFNQFLTEDFYFEDLYDENIEEDKGEFWFRLEEEPLFKRMEGQELI